MANVNSKISILDIHQSAFLKLHGKDPELILQGTRIVFSYEVSPEIYRLLNLYNENPEVSVLDFVHALRRLRSEMLTMKSVNGVKIQR